ncbi:MAG: transcriptional regulator [Bacteroidetes bacterium SW_10_40_5]|nr:MAG: transcriptional regulator [Bacteroidetes bacterium SW_10_40_5]
MPKIDEFNGIKIYIYNGDHRPPHIHAIYNEFEVLLTIKTGEIYAGDLPTKQFMLVADWLDGNADWALEVFYELNPELK